MPTTSETTYRRVLTIARGGMGRVELVLRRQDHFERLHALKRLRDTYLEDPEVRKMFMDEARIAGLIRHPNVVSVTDVGEDDEGPFLVMDYVEGASLGTLLSKLIAGGGAMPMTIALSLMAQVADGLHAAHTLCDSDGNSMSVIHRDVSPQNILLGFDGFARVTDFGIAKALGRSAKTQTGVLKGKMGYLSPEALRFEDIDHRADLFSFGVVLYEVLSGRRLYPTKDGVVGARAILNDAPPDLGDEVEHAPVALVELMFSLLAKDPADRPKDADEVATRLRAVLWDLEAEVGPADTKAYLYETLSEERALRVQAIEDGRRQLSARVQRPTRRWLLPAVAFVLLGLAGLVALAMAGPAVEPEVVEAHIAPISPTPEESPATMTPVDAPTESDEAAANAEPTMERRRRRRAASMMRRQASMGSTPMWGWQP